MRAPPAGGESSAVTSVVTLTPLLRLPEVQSGDDLAEMLLTALQDNGIQLLSGDILVISSKVVSKAMGLHAPSSDQAQVVLSQTVRIVAERRTLTGITRIVESAAGPVMTAGGVDASNTADGSILLLLPEEPDAVAARIRAGVQAGWAERTGAEVVTGVVLSDTAGRPWRNGQTDFALGASGIQVIDDLRGSTDANGRVLSVTERCVADEIAAAADLVKGKALGVPAAHLRGLGRHVRDDKPAQAGPGVGTPPGARDLVRTGAQDWFGYGMLEAVRAALGVEPGTATAAEVGIPFITPEGVATRAARAMLVALLPFPDASAGIDGSTIVLTAPDDFTLGAVATRAEVAMHGEGLATTMTRTRSLPTPPDLAIDDLLTARPTVLIVFQ
jgi:coenzyme F420-0:L-glutamate ligase/coenzyme F420-1:gamma-L-glutamate ligase